MLKGRFPFVIRCLIGLVLVGAGYLAIIRNVAAAWSKADPVSAMSVFGGDARVMARAAQVMMERPAANGSQAAAVALARKALSRDGTAVSAVDTLGLSAALAGNNSVANNWFAYSERLSRRDLPTQLYLLEKAVNDGNVKEALRHYDIALRSANDSGTSLLFPILRNATSDPLIRRELAQTLRGKPIWSSGFLVDLVRNGPDYSAAAELLLDARRGGLPIEPDLDETLLGNLVARGETASAWQYYKSIHPAAARVLIRNGTFKSVGAASTPFDWQLVPGSGVSVELGAGQDDRGLDYRLSPTVVATVARQTLLLPPGRYRLDSVLREASQMLKSGPYWELKCGDERSLASLEMGGPIENSKKFSIDFTVPPKCETQSLALTVRASDDVQGATGLVDSVSVMRLQ
ncbi:hypothetical protein FPZ24_05335 [Sphingomonas panacisoli]|uniref:Uncharacterized protein n=1 Tax=Sphingomonas panacisoli TaxID=1813879 RepID=A0A5B8LH78_9SPHN|nr:hypothetical protein [Sphingomonas panacisoli]QDZ06974.1 hypothetical protein FPZ24_05335 [Sphingomonas panacisoli]